MNHPADNVLTPQDSLGETDIDYRALLPCCRLGVHLDQSKIR